MTRNHLRLMARLLATSALLLSGCLNLDPPWARKDANADSIRATGGAMSKPSITGGSRGNAAFGGSASSAGGTMATGGTPAPSSATPVATGGSEMAATSDGDGAIADGEDPPIRAEPDACLSEDVSTPADTPEDVAADVPVMGDAGADIAAADAGPALDSLPDVRDVDEDPAGIVDAGATPDTPQVRSPVAYFPCEKALAASLPDQSGNNRNATLVGTFAFVAGKAGNALSLTPLGAAPGYVALPAGILASATEMTIAAWVKMNINSGWARIFQFGNDTNTFMFLTPNNTYTGKLRFGITKAGTGGEQVVDGDAALPTGAWKHVAVTLGSAGARLYVNGVQVGTSTAVTLRPNDLGSTVDNWIGRSEFPSDPYLDGLIDEFRIYESELSPAEILALFKG